MQDKGRYYENIMIETCETKKKDAPGTNPKHWDYIWKRVVEAVDVSYNQKGVFPSKDKMIAIMDGMRKECYKANFCEEQVRRAIQDCIKKYGTENGMNIVDEEFMEKHMNDANCKLHLEFLKGEGGKKIDELVKRAAVEFHDSSLSKEYIDYRVPSVLFVSFSFSFIFILYLSCLLHLLVRYSH